MPMILALTFPGSRPIASTDFEGKIALRKNGLSALLTNENRWSVLAPLVAVAATGLVNWVVIEPLVVGIMKERKHQGTSSLLRGHSIRCDGHFVFFLCLCIYHFLVICLSSSNWQSF